MGKLTEMLRNATSLRIITASKAESFERELLDYKQRMATLEAENKSLRDSAITGQYDSSSGSISLFPSPYPSSDGLNTTRLFKKRNVRMLRNYAEYSVWVRAAIDIYRNVIEQAEWNLSAFDSSKPINERSHSEIQSLLDNPNPTGATYSTIKGQMIEDYLVLGHGVIEKPSIVT